MLTVLPAQTAEEEGGCWVMVVTGKMVMVVPLAVVLPPGPLTDSE